MNIYNQIVKKLSSSKKQKEVSFKIKNLEIDNGEALPNIIFPNTISMLSLGKWLQIFSCETDNKLIHITPNSIKTIGKELGKIFFSLGISPNETVLVSHLKEGTFKAIVVSQKRKQKATYEWKDSQRNLTLFSRTNKDSYTIFPDGSIKLKQEILEDKQEKVSLSSWQRNESYQLKLKKKNLEITIRMKTLLDKEENEKEKQILKSSLLQPSFTELPFEELFSSLSRNLTRPLEEYPYLMIERTHFTGEKEMLDKIEIQSGELLSFTLTKDERQITIGKTEEDWCYKQAGMTFEKSKGNPASYTLSAVEVPLDTSGPRVDYKEVKEEIQKVKVLAKSLLTKKELS